MLNTELEFKSHYLKLTPRGAEVFRLILEGVTDHGIAKRLGISYSGVRRHKEKMLLANGCASMLELVAKYHMENAGPDSCGPPDV